MNIAEFRTELVSYLNETGISQSELSRVAGVPQSQLSSWINGSGKRISKNSMKVSRVIENYRKSDEAPIPSNVATAVRDFCGSSKERSEILTQMIQSLQPLAD
jgi:predicted transcriptional regulator